MKKMFKFTVYVEPKNIERARKTLENSDAFIMIAESKVETNHGGN